MGVCTSGYLRLEVNPDDNDERYYGERNELGQRHGQGTYYFVTGDYYIGNWWKGRIEGQGKYVFACGDSDEGWFYKNKCRGERPNRALRRKIKKGLIPAGASSLNAPVRRAGDGVRDERYVGNYENEMPHGQGAYFYRDGSFYKGNWRKGRMEGKGRKVDSKGNESTGWFYKNNYVGEQPNDDLVRKIRRGLIPGPYSEASNRREASVDSDLDNLDGAAGFLELSKKLAEKGAKKHK